MHRNVTVCAISVLNGFCVFLLCARLWGAHKSNILKPTHSIFITLIVKILFNLLTDKGRLSVECMWNSSLLVLYTIFTHAADYYAFLTASVEPSPGLHSYYSLFAPNTTTVPRMQCPWNDYQFLASVLFLILVLCNPFVLRRRQPPKAPAVDDYLIMKYRKLLRRRNLHRFREQIQEYQLMGTTCPRKTQSHQSSLRRSSRCSRRVEGPRSEEAMSTSHIRSFTTGYSPVRRAQHGDQPTSQGDAALGRKVITPDGTGDNKCGIGGVGDSNSKSLSATRTQTDDLARALGPCRSRGVQCARQRRRFTKSVITRLSGPSKSCLYANSDKATNTSITLTIRKAQTKTKSVGMRPHYQTETQPSSTPQTNSKPLMVRNAGKRRCNQRDQDEFVCRMFNRMRGEVQHRLALEHSGPAPVPIYQELRVVAPLIAPPMEAPAPAPHMPCAMQNRRSDPSTIFKLDDLITAGYQTQRGLANEQSRPYVQCLDVTPTKEHSLNVLYVTDKLNFPRSSAHKSSSYGLDHAQFYPGQPRR